MERWKGWGFVAAQAVLLVALVLLPGGDGWSLPRWAGLAFTVLFYAGLAVMAVAALGLGSALTPTPVPKSDASLRSTGMYGLVRHPIYSGLLAVVVSMVARSGSWWMLAVGVVTIVFFHVKARWEEAKLAEIYPEYPAYAERTPRFVPRPRRR